MNFSQLKQCFIKVMDAHCQYLLKRLVADDLHDKFYYQRFKKQISELNEQVIGQSATKQTESEESSQLVINSLLRQIKQRQDMGGILYAQYREIVLLTKATSSKLYLKLSLELFKTLSQMQIQ